METIDVRGAPLAVHTLGSGRPLLYLHAEHFMPARTLPHLETLARGHRVIIPRHPGFAPEPAPVGIRTIDDLAYLYLDLLETLDLRDVTLVGASIGGWIALEMCVRNSTRIGRLALVGSVGVKFGGPADRDLADVFYLPEQALQARLYADPARFAPRFDTMPEEAVVAYARERQALAQYGWRPYLHNPGLKRWLHRVAMPTLVLWGEQDGFAPPDYGRSLAAALPKATFEAIPGAGHYPHIEQPEAVIRALNAFAAG